MLSLANDGRYLALQIDPHQRRQRTLDALITQVEVLSRESPVLMIFEDAHWIDPTSQEVLGRTIDRIAMLPVLMIVTFRPELDPPWIGQPHVTTLTINRLAQREVGALIDRIIGNTLVDPYHQTSRSYGRRGISRSLSLIEGSNYAGSVPYWTWNV